MQNGAMKAWLDSSYLAGANQSYIEQLYEDYLTDPGSVDDSWRSIFKQLPNSGCETRATPFSNTGLLPPSGERRVTL